MTAANYNLVIDQGSDFDLELTIKEEGVAKNLSGYSARAQMRPTISSSVVAGTFTCTILSAEEGKLKLSLPNADSSAIAAGRYFYDLELFTSNDAVVKRLLKGEVTLNAEVTR